MIHSTRRHLEFSRAVPVRAVLPVCLLLLGLGGTSSCSLPDDTAALVNDRPISLARLDRAYENFTSQFGEMAPPGEDEALRVRKILLERLIDQELMMQAAEKMNLRPAEEDVRREAEIVQGDLQDEEFRRVLGEAGYSLEEWKEKLLLDLAVEKLQAAVVHEKVAVTDGEIQDYHREHRTDFDVPEKVRASQILVKTREEAVAARRRIRAGEDFAAVAREVSLSPDGENGGDLGFFARGEMPQEFEAVIFSLSQGKLSSVVETTYGHHIFLLTERRAPRRRGEDEVRGEIRDILFAEKAEEAFQRWMRDLRAGADIRYNKKVVPDT
jgi:peptidyl-prolyl cis-trans isomerase C